ncbi:MAG: TIR domain-containing protein [Deltaproteobacteria bacterium]|nr:TIR domain-containing protein [Deltaproteobacteria bacterium]
MTYEFDVAVSFAGEDREFAEEIAESLREVGVSVFYDNYQTAQLWGEDLSVKFQEVYRDKSRYCIMIVSAPYLGKMWTILERRHAIERMIENKGAAYILPVRLDGFPGDVLGLPSTVHYLTASKNEAPKVVNTFLEKTGRVLEVKEKATSNSKVLVPKLLRKEFSDKEKNTFVSNSFDEIVTTLDEIVTTLDEFGHAAHREQTSLEHEIERVTSRKVVFTLYREGNELMKFKVWRGGMLGSDSICFAYGRNLDVENDNTMNEQFTVTEHKGTLMLSPLGMLTMGSGGEKKHMSPSEVTEYLWEGSLRYT